MHTDERISEARGWMQGYLNQFGAVNSLELCEFMVDAVHSMAHRMMDSATQQIAVVRVQMNGELNVSEDSQALFTAYHNVEQAKAGELAHDLTLSYCKDLNLGLVEPGYEVLLVFIGTPVTKWAEKRLQDLGFVTE